jgi:hypothetical protein
MPRGQAKLTKIMEYYSPDGEVDEVCVDQNVVGGSQLLIVLKEKTAKALFNLPRFGLFLFLNHLFLSLFGIFLDSSILRADDLLRNCELAGFLCLPHDTKAIPVAATDDFAVACCFVVVGMMDQQKAHNQKRPSHRYLFFFDGSQRSLQSAHKLQ